MDPVDDRWCLARESEIEVEADEEENGRDEPRDHAARGSSLGTRGLR
jgi:hypothetical protein